MNAHIEAYLIRVKTRLWLKRTSRRDVLDELRTHLESLDPSASSVEDIAARFGDPVTLARRISRERPWWQTTAPWRPTIYLFIYIAFTVMVQSLLRGSNYDLAAEAVSWSLSLAVAIASAAVVRQGAHPVHAVLTGIRPALIFSVSFLLAVMSDLRELRPALDFAVTALVSMVLMSLALGAAAAFASRARAGWLAAIFIPPATYIVIILISDLHVFEVGPGGLGGSTHAPPALGQALLIAVAFAATGWLAARIAVGKSHKLAMAA